MSNQVAIGRFGSPYGVKGWVKIISYTSPPEKMLDYLPWCIFKDETKIILDHVKGKLHGNNLVAQIGQCQDRDTAKTYTNIEIFIDRQQLPEPTKDEFYWVDLIGLSVINCEKENLGKVQRLFETGSNDVIIVKDDNGKERYIPYIQDVILEVNLKNKIIHVDWDATF